MQLLSGSPRPAERGIGLEPMPRKKACRQQKKPGDERRANPSFF
jgi:hypothetical protein